MDKVNLYRISVVQGDNYCCFVFAATANKAKSLYQQMDGSYFDTEYTDLRANIVKKDVGGETDVVVDLPENEDYYRVLAAGGMYTEEDE